LILTKNSYTIRRKYTSDDIHEIKLHLQFLEFIYTGKYQYIEN